MVKTLILGVLTLAITLFGYLYFYLGVNKPVSVAVENRGPFYLIYKSHVGPYHRIVPVIAEVEQWALSHNLACMKTFGEYLDNPETVDEDRLRSHGGCILSAPLAQVPPEYDYQVRPERSYAIGQFQGSPAIGPYKVYPKVRQYLSDNRLKSNSPVIEIYKVDGNSISTEYLFAIDK